MTARIHHPACPCRVPTANLDECVCRDGVPVVNLTDTLQHLYQQADQMREHALMLQHLADNARYAADAFERLATILDGSSTQGDEPRACT